MTLRKHSKRWLKGFIFFLAIAIFLMNTGFVAFADSSSDGEIDGAPVEGTFIADPEYAAEIAQKEYAALQQLQELEQQAIQTRSDITGRILAIMQVPQQNDYYCGYAAIKSVLDYKNIIKTQTQIAEDVYYSDEALAWYRTNGSELTQFPAAVGLREYTNDPYVPFPYGAAGGTPISASDIEWRVRSAILNDRGVLACGTSQGSTPGSNSILPGYPAQPIHHWIVVKGYSNNGSTMWIADPAKSPAVTWSDSISAQYSISSVTLAAYAQTRGIIW